jgi:hypothetical protein
MFEVRTCQGSWIFAVPTDRAGGKRDDGTGSGGSTAVRNSSASPAEGHMTMRGDTGLKLVWLNVDANIPPFYPR